MNKLDVNSMNIVNENIEKLKEIFPEVFSENKIDFEKLQEELGEFVDDKSERYNFTWNGKAESKKIALTPSTGTLRPCKEESKNFDTTQNLYIEGDNLEVLKLLQKSYHKKVKMIYIDPPYNTGKDFVYKDNFKDNIKNYLEQTGQVDSEGNRLSTNSDTSGRYHSDWLNMMYPRLKLARNLLKDDGVIFISIDDNEVTNLRKLCDEVFGEDNFISELVWEKKTGASDSKTISTITESVIVYVKSQIKLINIFERNMESFDLSRYRLKDEFYNERGPYYFDNLDRGGLQYSDSLNFGIESSDGKMIFPNGRTDYFNDGWIWKWGKEKVKWGFENKFLEVRPSKNKKCGFGVYYKNYLNVDNECNLIERSAPMKNLILGVKNSDGSSDIKSLFSSRVFQYTKPVSYISKIINFAKSENEIILDFFSGSGTIAHSIMKLNGEDSGNRKFICVQLPEETDIKSEAYKAGYKTICEIGKERIRRAGEKILEENKDKDLSNLDIGFKVLKLDSSNIKTWDSDYEDLEQNLLDSVDNIKEDRTNEDLLYEILLKYGLDLTLPIEELNINDKKVFSIGYGALIVCLDSDIDTNTVEQIAQLKKQYEEDYGLEDMKVVFKDNGFKDAVVKTNSLQILKQHNINEIVSI